MLTWAQIAIGILYSGIAHERQPNFRHRKKKIGTRSVHVGSRKKDQLAKLVICEITLNALFFPFMFSPSTNLTFREF